MLWLTDVELLDMGCVWLLLICSFWVCKDVILVIDLNALISEGSSGSIGTV